MNGMSEGSALWTPDPAGFAWQGNTSDEVTQAYALFLEVCHPEHLKRFQDRLKADPEAARAEAAVFSWLRTSRLAPAINEHPSRGGADFLCLPGEKDSFLLEVTSLRKDAIASKSGWPDDLDEGAAAFSMVTPQISRTIQHKVPQLAGGPQDVARVLAICLSHSGASALLGTMAAERVVTSTPVITTPLAADGTASEAPRLVTNLKQSAFFCIKNGVIVPVRERISAILLIGIWDRQLEIVGMLHPAPTTPFAYRLLGDVPFLRVEWPIRGSEIDTEWIIGHPRPLAHYHSTVTLTDKELKRA
jgi:hypothetical protein